MSRAGEQAGSARPGSEFPAVTITAAKRKGTNATMIAQRILKRVEELRGNAIPSDLNLTVTRNYGETAKDKSNELLLHMLLAASRSASDRLHAGLARVGHRLPGHSGDAGADARRVLSLRLHAQPHHALRADLLIGILVDDAIVVVENIVRHWRMPENRGRPLSEVAVEAVDEVGNPTILATFAVVAAILPMAFVGGLMGPYMRPIPVGASPRCSSRCWSRSS